MAATVLILSSHVAASRVGGRAQAAMLERMGVETILVPTVIFGRHPGLGAPGGGAVSQEILDGAIAGVEASGALGGVDAVITGYFATAAQARTGVRLIDAVRQAKPSARIVVDPIMGDEETGLYVNDDVAEAIARDLIPRADFIAPNAWELARLAALPVTDAPSALAAVRAIGRSALVSSIPMGEDIGVLLSCAEGDFLASHPREAAAPKGTGDLLVANFVGQVVGSGSVLDALSTSVTEIAALVAGRPTDVRLRAL
ncbi:MAG TPA: bifunctional hydroxymethylpyrimidine kinase/phosphomethylpyrimidine kinase [Caulobacteraceae bacterium]